MDLTNKVESPEMCFTRYKDLVRQFSVKSSFLSGYQLRQLREKVKDLDKLISSFVSTSSIYSTTEISLNQCSSIKREEMNKLDAISSPNPADMHSQRIQIVNRVEEDIELDALEGDVIIDNLTKCKVKLSGPIRSIKIKNVTRSKIDVISYCNGPVYVENVQRSVLRLAGDQVRIHESSHSKIYLFTKSSCILEDCLHLTLSPNLRLEKINCNWKNIQDFSLNPESYTIDENADFNENDDNDLFLCDAIRLV